MLAKVVAVVVLGLALAAPEGERKPETRQALIPVNVNPNCPNYFQLNTNPCQSGQGRVYYVINGDPTKFVQCDVLGRAYVIQCPQGLYYNAATTSCQANVVVATQPPVSTPCTAQALQTGQIYFSYPGDNSRFYECTGLGQGQVLQCPQGLVWDGSRIACVYAAQGGYITNIYPTAAYPGSNVQFNNPCTPQMVAGNHYYFAHPDPTKFIQCDNAGQAFVVSCPSGLVWNQYLETCTNAFSQTIVGGGGFVGVGK